MQMNLKSLKNKTKEMQHMDIVALICLCCAVLFFVWKAPYGFGLDDESWYFTFPQRLTMGDSLLTHEWHVAQLISFFLYLPYKIYTSITGTTEGIILFFRYMFIVMQSIVSTVVYYRLKNYGFFSIIAALVIFLNIPFTIMSLSYYAMGIAFVTITGVLMATAREYNKATFYCAGISMAFAVICNPVLTGVFILYSVCVLAHEKTENKKKSFFKFAEVSFSFKAWLWIFFGILTVVTVFIVFLGIFMFSRSSLKEILENLPMLFTDPEYDFSDSGGQGIFTFKKTFFALINISPILFAVFSLLFSIILIDKKRLSHRLAYLAIAIPSFFAHIIIVVRAIDFPYWGYLMLPLTFLGLICYLLTQNKNKKAFVFLWLFGVLYMVCMDISSDVGYLTAFLTLTVSSIASILFIKDIIDELNVQMKSEENKKRLKRSLLITSLLIVASVFQIFQECYVVADLKTTIEYLAPDLSADIGASIQYDPNMKLDTTILSGPQKGIKTTHARVDTYNGILSDLEKIKKRGSQPVLIASNMPWCYLYLGVPFATHSTWFQAYNFGPQKQRLLEYYKLHPEKSPKYIYVPKSIDIAYLYMPERATMMLDGFAEDFSFIVQESDFGYTLEITSYN